MTDAPHTELAPLTPAVFHVLLSLADGERHGYGIMQEALRQSDGRFRMGPGTLYGTLQRLLEQELVEESDERPDAGLDDARRRYYKLTRRGRQSLKAELDRMAVLLRKAREKKLVPRAEEGL